MPPAHELVVYVLGDCPGCGRARELAAEAALRLAHVTVRVVDLGAHPTDLPDGVFSVPTWVLDGTVISLGNPRFATLAAALARRRGHGGADGNDC